MMEDIKVITVIANNLKWHRERCGYTQKEVSKLTGITDVSISRYENMKRVPDALAIYKLAGCYKISVSDLFN